MQFITNGPDIPDALLQAHEEGRVVFFCGAGISYPAGLPGFKGLVDEIYRRNDTKCADIERAAFDREQFDATLDLLERRVPGQRLAVRRALADALRPKLRRKGAIDTHAALLQLGRDRKGALRLVTTNFDRVFHAAAKRSGQPFEAYGAPMLPIPKNSRWNGLVYLHGLLPKKADDAALNRLVVTSGDFGLAYLTERWASRFVSELFRNYVVCFVGYSINDPVLRYMMDAVAADRMLGQVVPQAWALGDCEPGQEARNTIEWKAKGVTPILYQVAAGTRDHSALHRTLREWAETYRDGVTGKERIVVAHALARPSASTQQDNFVGRMLWALSDPSGLPARRFAEFNPVPSLEWLLEAFAEDRYGRSDLARFGVPPSDEIHEKPSFSLISRPVSYALAPWMRLTVGPLWDTQWDDVMFQLGRWLVRHLGDPQLMVWIAERGGQLHERLVWLIENRLDELAELERDGKTSELEDIRSHAPNAIPSPLMLMLWRVLLGGRVKSPWREADLYRWKSRLKRNGLTATLRLELRELLSPRVSLRKPFRWTETSESAVEPTHLRQIVDWELVLAADNVLSGLRDLESAQWQAVLPALLDDVKQLLHDALDLLNELGEADERSDRSHWDLPSISTHWQNRGFRDWVSLIELLRNAWLGVRSIDGALATRIALTWFDLRYPVFKRLALFAASQEGSVPSEQWAEWLVADNAWWLWAVDTQREVLRLLVLQGSRLAPPDQQRLVAAILAGPPRSMYGNDVEPDRWHDLVARSVWLYLAKLSSSGVVLGADSASRLAELSRLHPQWQLAANESDEFPHWMSGTGDPDYEDSRDVDIAPRKRRELVQWLAKPPPEKRPLYEDTWRDVCRTRFFHSFYALCDLAKQSNWPGWRWREALQVWSEEELVLRSWRFAAPLIESMPDGVLEELARSVSWWLQAVSKSIDRHESIFLGLCQRLITMLKGEEPGIGLTDHGLERQPVTAAINHPVGYISQALINLWFNQSPEDGSKLPVHVDSLFTAICDISVPQFRPGRVILASRLIAFFRVDRSWTEQNLLKLFDWNVEPSEARSAWEGFMWSPRLYRPLLHALKPHFFATAHHYAELGPHSKQFSAFLCYAALEFQDEFAIEEWLEAFSALPRDGLRGAARALYQSLEGAAAQREEHWQNRILPVWKAFWPKSNALITPEIADPLARVCLAAGHKFEEAVNLLGEWLVPIERPGHLIQILLDRKIPVDFPETSLRFVFLLARTALFPGPNLRHFLDLISGVSSGLAQRPEFQALQERVRRL